MRIEEWFFKVWVKIPRWVFAVVGTTVCLGYVAARVPDYLDFWNLGPRYRFGDGTVVHVPFTRLLADLTFVLMAVSFSARLPPLAGPKQARQIWVAALGGAWPMLPFLLDAALTPFPDARHAYKQIFMGRHLSAFRLFTGAGLIVVGNFIDVWAYAVLCRSFSVVPEARALVTRGPYRFIRHPVYVGQILAQAGIYLFFAKLHGGWALFWIVFVAIQLRRAAWEEQVLERAFGDEYLAYKKRTRWLWR